jgi:Skp family chaperone for outer membrane proteins
MLKSIWLALSLLAILNLLALAGFVAWLHSSGRLNAERIEQTRALFTPTLAESTIRRAAEEAALAAATAAQAQTERQNAPPVSAAARLEHARTDADVRLQQALRREKELESLRASLHAEQDRLQRWQDDLTTRERAFDDARRRIADIEGSEQFRTALATLEGQKPKDAKAMLMALLDLGQRDQVVAYLANLEEGKRSKVLAEFIKTEPPVAAELLERLRTRGLGDRPRTNPRDPAQDAPGQAQSPPAGSPAPSPPALSASDGRARSDPLAPPSSR